MGSDEDVMMPTHCPYWLSVRLGVLSFENCGKKRGTMNLHAQASFLTYPDILVAPFGVFTVKKASIQNNNLWKWGNVSM